MSVSRREVMAGAAAVGLTALAGIGGAALLRPPGFDRADIAELLALLPDMRAAGKIGAVWLGRHGELAASWATLPDLVTGRLRRSGWRGGSADALRAQVAEIVRTDFDQGAIEDVDGWRISRFQAELCALAHLDVSRPRST